MEYNVLQAKKIEAQPITAPITHPLLGVDPNKNPNDYADSNNTQRQQVAIHITYLTKELLK